MTKNLGGKAKQSRGEKKVLLACNWVGFSGFIFYTAYRWLEISFSNQFGFPSGSGGALTLPSWCNIILLILLLVSFILCIIGLFSAFRSIMWLIKNPKAKKCAVFVSFVAALASCLMVIIYLFN